VKKGYCNFARISYYNLSCFPPVCTCEEEKEKQKRVGGRKWSYSLKNVVDFILENWGLFLFAPFFFDFFTL